MIERDRTGSPGYREHHQDIIQQSAIRPYKEQHGNSTKHKHQIKTSGQQHLSNCTQQVKQHAITGFEPGTSGLKQEHHNQLDLDGPYKTGFLLALLQTIRVAQLQVLPWCSAMIG